jgi:cytochrome P450
LSTALKHAESWAKTSGHWGGDTHADVDLTEHVAQLTQDIVAQALFGVELGDKLKPLQKAWNTALTFMVERARNPLLQIPLTVPTPSNRRFHQAMRVVNETVDEVIRFRLGRRSSAGTESDHRSENLLTRLIAARGVEGSDGYLSDQEIRDQILAFLFAGHETTANNIAWTLYLVLSHPGVERALRSEMDQVFPPGAKVTVAGLEQLKLLRQVIYESLRLYPPAAMFVREATEDVEILGRRLAKGSMIFLSPFVIQRRTDLWSDPLRFDPSRFETLPKKNETPLRFLAFGAGPRACIGEQFAIIEAQIVMLALLRSLDIRLLTTKQPELHFNGTLRPRELLARILKRETPARLHEEVGTVPVDMGLR